MNPRTNLENFLHGRFGSYFEDEQMLLRHAGGSEAG